MTREIPPRASQGSQVARLENLLGRKLIGTAPGEEQVTDDGRMVLRAARELLARTADAGPVRVGVSSIFIEKFASEVDELASERLFVSTSVCTQLVKSYLDGELDVVLVLDVLDHREKLSGQIVDEHPIPMVWMQAQHYATDKAAAIPLATWPGDGLAVRTLDAAGTSYATMFSSNDYFAKLAAVRSGRYVSMMPRSALSAPFVEAKDDRLPKLPVASALIAQRMGSASPRMRQITAKLATAYR